MSTCNVSDECKSKLLGIVDWEALNVVALSTKDMGHLSMVTQNSFTILPRPRRLAVNLSVADSSI